MIVNLSWLNSASAEYNSSSPFFSDSWLINGLIIAKNTSPKIKK